MGVILQVALPSRVLAAARLQCGAAGAGASRGLGVCAEHARLAARGESARAMEIGDFLVGLGPGGNSQCVQPLHHPSGRLSLSRAARAPYRDVTAPPQLTHMHRTRDTSGHIDTRVYGC